jgi:hypothetical protein
MKGGDAEEELERSCAEFIKRFEVIEDSGRLGSADVSELYFTK